jgi:hypothetical protein
VAWQSLSEDGWYGYSIANYIALANGLYHTCGYHPTTIRDISGRAIDQQRRVYQLVFHGMLIPNRNRLNKELCETFAEGVGEVLEEI